MNNIFKNCTSALLISLFSFSLFRMSEAKPKVLTKGQKTSAAKEISTLKAQVVSLKKQVELLKSDASKPHVNTESVHPGSKFSDGDMNAALFRNINLANSKFDDINLAGATFFNINMSDISIQATNLGGAKFKHIGPAPNSSGKDARQKAITFEEMQLCDSIFTKVDMSKVQLNQCNVEGMTIDGVLVTDLLTLFKKQVN